MSLLPADPKLGSWRDTQRKYEKRLDAGDLSPVITAERVAKLEVLGFEWSPPNSGATNEAGWEAMLLKLAAFKAEHGHCRCPRGRVSKRHPELGRWVGKQRQCKKRLDAGDSSPSITVERVAKLEALGFEWSPPLGGIDEAGWEARLSKLAAFKAEHGHCRVLWGHPADPKLGRWVGNQRMYKKRLDAGEPSSCITEERVAKLEAIGFEWVVLKRKR